MFHPNLSKAQLQRIVDDMSGEEVARFLYCQEMAGAYLAVGKFEDMLIHAMHMCDFVKIKEALGPDTDHWAQSLEKKAILQRSTLGSLIRILERRGISQADIHYLKWIKDKRDYFVHRLFHDGAWPGDLGEQDCRLMSRRLLAIQLWLNRAERNLWSIFERAGFVALSHHSDGSALVANLGICEPEEI